MVKNSKEKLWKMRNNAEIPRFYCLRVMWFFSASFRRLCVVPFGIEQSCPHRRRLRQTLYTHNPHVDANLQLRGIAAQLYNRPTSSAVDPSLTVKQGLVHFVRSNLCRTLPQPVALVCGRIRVAEALEFASSIGSVESYKHHLHGLLQG